MIAGIRWTTEENFQAAKGLTGLDEHQVRRWAAWYRWTTLAMLALAFLTIAAATEHTCHPPPPGQIPLTRHEIATLFGTLVIKPARDARHQLRWSAWRRRHQHRAKTCHYQRQARLLRVTRYEHAASAILNTAETAIFCSAATAS